MEPSRPTPGRLLFVPSALVTATYYEPDLAWVHHAGYSQHVESVAPGILRLLGDSGLDRAARVLDVGGGSCALAHKLIAAGYVVHGVKRRSSSFNTDRVDHL